MQSIWTESGLRIKQTFLRYMKNVNRKPAIRVCLVAWAASLFLSALPGTVQYRHSIEQFSVYIPHIFRVHSTYFSCTFHIFCIHSTYILLDTQSKTAAELRTQMGININTGATV